MQTVQRFYESNNETALLWKTNWTDSSGLEHRGRWAGPRRQTLLTLRNVSLASGFQMSFQVSVSYISQLFVFRLWKSHNYIFFHTQMTTESLRI